MIDDVVVTGLGATTPLGGDVASTWAACSPAGPGSWPSPRTGPPTCRCGSRPGWRSTRPRCSTGSRPGGWTEPAGRADRRREAWADAGFTGQSGRDRPRPRAARRRHRHRHRRRADPARPVRLIQEKGPGRVSPLHIPMLMPNGPAALRRPRARRPGRRAHPGQRLRVRRRGDRARPRPDPARPRRRRRRRRHRGLRPPAAHRRASPRCGRCRTRNDEPERASRPFDKGRDGFVLGEGAGALVLERRARRGPRAAQPYAVLAGAGITSDAYDIAQPDPDGDGRAARARIALRAVGPRPSRHRARQRARHLDPGRRHRRGPVRSPTARRPDRCHRHQVDDRAPARRRRRARVDRDRARPPRRRRPADDQPRRPRRRASRSTSPRRGTRDDRACRAEQLLRLRRAQRRLVVPRQPDRAKEMP